MFSLTRNKFKTKIVVRSIQEEVWSVSDGVVYLGCLKMSFGIFFKWEQSPKFITEALLS